MADFPKTTCAFLKDLATNNNRDWLAENRARYESEWLEPAVSYVSALKEAMRNLDPSHKAEPKVNGSIRRLHRDTRFSKDKTPFDPKLHLVFWTGDHPNRSPAIHIVLHPDRAGFGAGQFNFNKTELDRYRQAISADEGVRQDLRLLLDKLAKKGCTLTDETLKTVPKGFSLPDQDDTLLKRKGLVVKTANPGLSPEALCNTAMMSDFFTVAAKLNAWLMETVRPN